MDFTDFKFGFWKQDPWYIFLTLLSLINFFLTQHSAQRYFSKHTQIVMDPPAPLHHFDLYFDCSLTKIIQARVQSGRWMKYLSYRCEKTPPPPKQALSCISCASLPAPIFSAPRWVLTLKLETQWQRCWLRNRVGRVQSMENGGKLLHLPHSGKTERTQG